MIVGPHEWCFGVKGQSPGLGPPASAGQVVVVGGPAGWGEDGEDLGFDQPAGPRSPPAHLLPPLRPPAFV